jgi:hypothetical protein
MWPTLEREPPAIAFSARADWRVPRLSHREPVDEAGWNYLARARDYFRPNVSIYCRQSALKFTTPSDFRPAIGFFSSDVER